MMSGRVLTFAAVLVIAGFLWWQGAWIIFSPLLYWTLAFGAALFLALIFGGRRRRSPLESPPGEFLCDRCRYSYGDACTRPERPNATRCPDFRAR